jgi:UDP-N-acetylmuramoyl-L-alanyl-D-glutamate--2,6-diaminopimelate ligase
MTNTNRILGDVIDWMKQLAPKAQLTSDSRAIKTGDIFFAFPVTAATGDGRKHIKHAIDNGAAGVVFDSENFVWDESITAAHFPVAQLRDCLGAIANLWYGKPDLDMFVVAVTGTNGKTSCSQWLAKVISQTSSPCAVIGTLGVGNYIGGALENLVETGFTTPDAIQLQRRLFDLHDAGAKALAIEASSIGLEQGRLNGLHVDVALLTNLTRDHLDYHGDMDAYAAAKTILFDRPDLSAAVVNLDDEYGMQMAQRVHMQSVQQKNKVKVFGYSLEQKEHPCAEVIYASNLRTHHAGTNFHVDSVFGSGLVKTQMIGRFNVSNVLGVLSVLLAKGIKWDAAVSAIEKLESVPGRMQQLGSAGRAMVVIDYAHTPDALEKTLLTLQRVAIERQGELWCVFGCGGDRDPGKRPQMGRIAEVAQHVVVTSDNPRTEKPAAIIQDILKGMSIVPHAIEDRASAILFAIKNADKNDVVLLAGKGHETYQDIAGKKWPFSDEKHALLALASVAASGNMLGGR